MFPIEVSHSGSHMNLDRKLVALIVSIMLSGCADFSALRNCNKSGEAYFAGIPLASHSEHEQAQRLKPLNPGNCLLYIVREHDCWTGASVRRTTVFLTPKDLKHYLLQTACSELPSLLGDEVVEIYDNVYSMWELPPNTYLLKAIFNRNFGLAQDHAHALKVLEDGPFKRAIAQVEIDCRPGNLLFFAVGDLGFSNQIVLKELTEEDGKAYITRGIRSVGFTDGNYKVKSWYKGCPADEQHQ